MTFSSRTLSLFKQFYRVFIVVALPIFISFNTFAANKQGSNNFDGSVNGTVSIMDKEGNRLEDHSDVVVFIDGLSQDQIKSAENTAPKMSHKGQRFSPRVFPISKGTSINFLNDDGIFHNVFSLSKTKPFDLGIYPSGAEKHVQFDQPGLVKVYCNIHPNMISNVLVLNNPLFSKTDANGNYEIKNIPEGSFTMRVWYELGDDVRREINIKKGGRLEENFILTKNKYIKKHSNKFGKPYRQKY